MWEAIAVAAQVGQPVVGHIGEPLDPRDVVAAVRRELATDRGSSAERVEQMRGELHRAAAASLTAIGGGIARQPPE